MNDTVRLFIGSSANGEDCEIEAAYEHSLRKNTKRNLEITWMRQTNDLDSPWGGWNTTRWSTPFSGFRWAIPEVCGFEGRAIYTDCDMINYRDIGELWDIDMNGKPLAAREGQRFGGHEFCVTLIDCKMMSNYVDLPIARMKNMDSLHHRLIDKFSGNASLVHSLDPRWNVLDGEEYKIDEIWQLHFTKMATQPWKPAWFTGVAEEHPRKDIVAEFHRASAEALANGYVHSNINLEPVTYNIIGR